MQCERNRKAVGIREPLGQALGIHRISLKGMLIVRARRGRVKVRSERGVCPFGVQIGQHHDSPTISEIFSRVKQARSLPRRGRLLCWMCETHIAHLTASVAPISLNGVTWVRLHWWRAYSGHPLR